MHIVSKRHCGEKTNLPCPLFTKEGDPVPEGLSTVSSMDNSGCNPMWGFAMTDE